MKRIFILSSIVLLFACSEQNTEKFSSNKPSYKVTKEEAKLWIKASKLFKPLPEIKNQDSTMMSRIQLGKMLYFDKQLSKNGTISCNSCHNLDTYGVDNKSTSTGDDGRNGDRNSPTSLNAFLHTTQFWDGRAKDVEEQAKGPILNPIEMGIPSKEFLLDRLSKVGKYTSAFANSFPNQSKPMTYDNIGTAIGAFERTLITPSPFDKYLNNDFEALGDLEKEGLKNFIEIGCATCHNGVAIGGGMFQTFGQKYPYWNYTNSKKIDLGLYNITKEESDKYKFKVPSLRNITKTAPYFHDGSVANLTDAVTIMAKIQLDKELSDKELKSILAFLKSLEGEVPASARKI
ncbi:MAG: cytochrome-c peroxidase [Bacteroidota bacterium]|nr:cytochrome-c peroxidase [Bacteroidota bacterium]